MARQETANTILNDTALEVGLAPVTDPYASQDKAFVQLQGLLNSAGRELCILNDWQILRNIYSITVQEGDDGVYDLPDDFSRMIDQTGWDKGNRVPVGGPLSPQEWTYLEGRDLVSETIYAAFRLVDGKFDLFPQPPPVNLNVTFEYISRNWVKEAGAEGLRKDRVGSGTDTVLYDPILTVKVLKFKFLSAKGLDTAAASRELDLVWGARTGQDTGAQILNAGGGFYGVPYLSGWRNISDSGFGGV